MPEDAQAPATPEETQGGGGKRRRRPLDSLMQVRRELARVYWEQDEGKLPMDTAKGKAYLLSVMLAFLKAEQSDDAEIERRLAELERRLADAKQRTPAPH